MIVELAIVSEESCGTSHSLRLLHRSNNFNTAIAGLI